MFPAHQRVKQCIADQLVAFKELNVLASWSHPYSTLDPSYQATVMRAFGDLFAMGYVVREFKPVYWSKISRFASTFFPFSNTINFRSAISESELDYNTEHESPSLYFLVELAFQPAWIPSKSVIGEQLCFPFLAKYRKYPSYAVVWTTTPWTIVANEAIIFSPSEK